MLITVNYSADRSDNAELDADDVQCAFTFPITPLQAWLGFPDRGAG